MGLTQCRRFVLTYTVNVEIDDTHFMRQRINKYKLYIWVLEPGKSAYRGFAIPLFQNVELRNPFNIYIFQWPKQFDKLVVFGER